MAFITKTTDRRPDASAIVSRGAYYILDRCAAHDEVYPKVCDAFYAAVRELVGEEAEQGVRQDGLGMLHKHFPTEKVLLLEEHVRLALRETLYYWSYRVGRDDLTLPHPFYVDHLIVMRIHFPFEVARKAKKAEQPPRSNEDLVDHAIAAISNPMIVVNQVSRALRRSLQASTFAPTTFHGDLTKPARSHGAHIDTWYGHSFDGINVWWSIDGVTVDNTVILYPDMFGRPVDYDDKNMYLAKGQQISEPHQVDLKPGQLLLFNPEMLHATQVNVSDRTRVALTTRINPHKPEFNDEAPFNFEHWHNSRALERRKFRRMEVYPAAKHKGAPSHEARPRLERHRTELITLNRPLSDGPACAGAQLPNGTKVAIDFTDAKVILWRTPSGDIKAYSRICPHVGVDLVDGWHDEGVLHCPGHGLRFDWKDGQSNCATFKLRVFSAVERDGNIYVSRTSPQSASQTAEAVSA